MKTADHRFPTRRSASAGARLGCHRHFRAIVVPFLRNAYALRPLKAQVAPRLTLSSRAQVEDLAHVA